VLKGDSLSVHSNDGHGWELFEMKAYIKGNWKILRLPQPMGSGEWELYNIEKDPAETTDLSSQFPDIKEELINSWGDYAKRNEIHDHHGHYDTLYRASFVAKEKV
jgi:arylsulfatase A-like enzyme